MSRFEALRKEFDERVLMERFSMPHDEARLKYKLASNTVKDTADFERAIGDYYAYHHSQCVCHGGTMPEYRAVQAAKRVVRDEYKRKDMFYSAAVADAKNGTNGGMRLILDCIADAMKYQDIDDYISHTVDRYTTGDSFAEKRAMIQDMVANLGSLLPDTIHGRPPEDFIPDYRDLLCSIITRLTHLSLQLWSDAKFQ